MINLTTKTGRVIACDAVIRATNYAFLTIHTHDLTRIEIDTIFDNPEETEELTVVEISEQEPVVTVYRRWTVLYSVQRSPMFQGDLMIWLTRPEED